MEREPFAPLAPGSDVFRPVREFAEALANYLPRLVTPLMTVQRYVPPGGASPLPLPGDGKTLRQVNYVPARGPVLRSSISIIVPTYNEEGTIRSCLAQCLEVMEGSAYDYEIMVVDDGSTDRTYARAMEVARGRRDRVRILRHPRNLGKGRAVRTGALSARKEILVIQDADLEYSPSEIPHLVLPVVQEGYDVLYGSRFLGVTDGMRTSHRVGNWILTATTNVLYGTSFTDVMTGHKVFTREAFRRLGLRAEGFAFEVECTARVMDEDLNVAEIPIEYRVRRVGEAKIRWVDGIRCLAWVVGMRVRNLLPRVRDGMRAS